MANLKDMYKVKKKRPVDPNAPPRPNLLSHEKVLKDTKITIEQLQHQNNQLSQRVSDLEAKLTNQTAYLNVLHQAVQRKS
jgi:predicted RNase H-like nuclease (RuvC/YqgF family)